MPSLLKIDISPRFEHSVSRALGEKFLAAWKAKHPDGAVVTRDLAKDPLPFVDLPWITGAFTPPESHSPEAKTAIGISNQLVDELLAADEIVITTPLYNFAMPSALKAWIDHLVRAGRTFNAKYEGLVTGKKVTVIVASGGSYVEGSPVASWDYFTPYTRFILGFMGLTDVRFIYGDNARDVAQGKISLEDYVAQKEVTA